MTLCPKCQLPMRPAVENGSPILICLRCEYLAPKRRNKFNNIITRLEGYVFQSKVEANHYILLKFRQARKEIKNLRVHPKYILLDKKPGQRALTYSADFEYVEQGRVVVLDVKSVATQKKQHYRDKVKLFKDRYPDLIFVEEIY